jgi:hypothetical protein
MDGLYTPLAANGQQSVDDAKAGKWQYSSGQSVHLSSTYDKKLVEFSYEEVVGEVWMSRQKWRRMETPWQPASNHADIGNIGITG